jgi:YfiH family protein
MKAVEWKLAGMDGECKRVEGWPALQGFIHGFSTRRGGSSNPPFDSLNLGNSCGDDPDRVEQNRQHFFRTTGCHATPLQTLKQIHSSEVVLVRRGQVSADQPPQGDALVTDQKHLLLGIYTADCYPILLVDPHHAVVAAVHAGWRGVAGGIVSRTIEAMKDSFGCRTESLLAFVGPGIGPCCYQVGQDVYKAIAGTCPAAESWFLSDPQPDERYGPKWRLDLQAGLRSQLEGSEIPGGSVFVLGDCTMCQTDLYFSYRRDGKATGRMLSIIGIAG